MSRGWLGVSIAPVTDEAAKELPRLVANVGIGKSVPRGLVREGRRLDSR